MAAEDYDVPKTVVPTFTQAWDGQKRPSMIELADKQFKGWVERLPVDLLESSELELEKMIRKDAPGNKFSRTHALLKIAFWDEYKRACKERTTMLQENVYHGICQREYWERFVLRNPLYLAWIVTPPTDELILQKELIQLGYKKIREAFEAPIYLKKRIVEVDKVTGERSVRFEKTVNVPLLKELHAIVRTLQDRIHGSVVHKHQVEQKTLQLNMNAPANTTVAGGGMSLLPMLDQNGLPQTVTLDELEKISSTLSQIQSTIEQTVPEVAQDADVIDGE